MLNSLMRLIYFVVWAYIIYSVYRFFRNLWRRIAPPAGKAQPRRVSGVMVKDEACGTYIPRDEAIKETIGGKDYFFCSKECRKKFLDASKKAR